jgi:hypothetical protein
LPSYKPLILNNLQATSSRKIVILKGLRANSSKQRSYDRCRRSSYNSPE